MAITFTVPGDPVPQPRPRVTTRNGFARAYVPKKHPIHAYREAVAYGAKLAGVQLRGEDPATVAIKFVVARPPSHLNKSGVKASAPAYPSGDVDNVAKAVLDALTGVAWADDKQVVSLFVEKSWGSESLTEVKIW
jgi:Holliday junction resolvase RusA-like endonuclease